MATAPTSNATFYTYSSQSGYVAPYSTGLTFSSTVQQPSMIVAGLAKNEITYSFLEVEHGVLVKAELSPDANMSPRESLDIQLLIAVLSTHLSCAFKPITYIRSKNLEKHFKFTT